MNKTSFAIGCLVQWYESDIIEEYLSTLRKAIDNYDGKVLVDINIATGQHLEKGTSPEAYNNCISKIRTICQEYKFKYSSSFNLSTISSYRREFNTKYCELADVLIWGESDMLVPSQTFSALNILHNNVSTPKYLATFGICKMWDDSWKMLEHPKFTDKPFIENDYNNWWSVKYTMTAKEMEEINRGAQDLGVVRLPQHKFNGCGLVISSEVIKAGVNIPQSVFFVHEDTAFMLMTQKILGNIPQYSIRNLLVVHNRNHPNKRNNVYGETGDTMNKKRRSNDWYVKANRYSEENCYNLFNPNYKAKTWKDVWK